MFVIDLVGTSPIVGTWDLDYKKHYWSGHAIDNDLMVIINETNTSIYVYTLNTLGDGSMKLGLSVDYHHTLHNDYSFGTISLKKDS